MQMKKLFVEPTIKKIELNLSENIASSESDHGGIHFMAHYTVCKIQNTNYTMNDPLPNMWVVMGCLSDLEDDTSKGTVLPVETFRRKKGL